MQEQRHVVADEAIEHLLEVAHEPRDLDEPRAQDLLAAERQELAGEVLTQVVKAVLLKRGWI